MGAVFEDSISDLLVFLTHPIYKLGIVDGTISVTIGLSEEDVHNVLSKEVRIGLLENSHHLYFVQYPIAIGVEMGKGVC